jgi:hypothetical protein
MQTFLHNLLWAASAENGLAGNAVQSISVSIFMYPFVATLDHPYCEDNHHL